MKKYISCIQVHIMGSCLRNRDVFSAERNHMGVYAVEKDMLLILDIITQVTGGGVTLVPCRCLRI